PFGGGGSQSCRSVVIRGSESAPQHSRLEQAHHGDAQREDDERHRAGSGRFPADTVITSSQLPVAFVEFGALRFCWYSTAPTVTPRTPASPMGPRRSAWLPQRVRAG